MSDFKTLCEEKGYYDAFAELEFELFESLSNLTHTQIARKLKLPRNSVISKMRRLGISAAKENNFENDPTLGIHARNPFYKF